jgi:hypothetical protein
MKEKITSGKIRNLIIVLIGIVVIAYIVLFIFVWHKGKEKPVRSDNTPTVTPTVTLKPTEPVQEDYLLTTIASPKAESVILPDEEGVKETTGKQDLWLNAVQENVYCYDHIDASAYRRKLREAGYRFVDAEQSNYISWVAYTDGCVILVYEQSNGCYVFAYTKGQTPDGGYTPDKASEILSTHGLRQDAPVRGIPMRNVEDLWGFYTPNTDVKPMDVTPEGMYEATGAQVFVTLLNKSDSLTRHFYIVYDGVAVEWQCGTAAFTDADGDGKKEILTIGKGASSGRLSATLAAYSRKDSGEVRVATTTLREEICDASTGAFPKLQFTEGNVEAFGKDVSFSIFLRGDYICTLGAEDRSVFPFPKYGTQFDLDSDDGVTDFLQLAVNQGVLDSNWLDQQDSYYRCIADTVSEEIGIQLFGRTDGSYFLTYSNKVYEIGGFGGGIQDIVMADLNGDGVKEAYIVIMEGSGISRECLVCFDPVAGLMYQPSRDTEIESENYDSGYGYGLLVVEGDEHDWLLLLKHKAYLSSHPVLVAEVVWKEGGPIMDFEVH